MRARDDRRAAPGRRRCRHRRRRSSCARPRTHGDRRTAPAGPSRRPRRGRRRSEHPHSAAEWAATRQSRRGTEGGELRGTRERRHAPGAGHAVARGVARGRRFARARLRHAHPVGPSARRRGRRAAHGAPGADADARRDAGSLRGRDARPRRAARDDCGGRRGGHREAPEHRCTFRQSRAVGCRVGRAHRATGPARRRRAGNGRGDGVRVSLRPDADAVRHRVPDERREPRRGPLRPARLRGEAPELPGDRQGRRAHAALVPARPPADAGGPGFRPDVVVGLDVRVPDAGTDHACADAEPPRPDVPPGGAAADRLRGRARRAVGDVGVGVQRARPRDDVPVLELRGTGTRAPARPGRRCRGRAVCHGTGGDVRAAGGGAQLPGPRRRRWRGPVRVLRGRRLHTEATAVRPDDGGGARTGRTIRA